MSVCLHDAAAAACERACTHEPGRSVSLVVVVGGGHALDATAQEHGVLRDQQCLEIQQVHEQD